jgi:hypothetical protein
MLENEDDTLSLALGQAFRRIVFLNVILKRTAYPISCSDYPHIPGWESWSGGMLWEVRRVAPGCWSLSVHIKIKSTRFRLLILRRLPKRNSCHCTNRAYFLFTAVIFLGIPHVYRYSFYVHCTIYFRKKHLGKYAFSIERGDYRQ